MTVDVARDRHVTIISIDRPAKRNAIDATVTAGLDAAFNAVEDDLDQRVAVLTGTADLFCAGTDLKDGPRRADQRGGGYGLVGRKRTKPLIAAVEGVAFGGGFELAMAADIVIAGAGARFSLPEVRRGVIANSGALFRAARALPRNLAKQLLLSGDKLGPEEAAAHGFVNAVVPAGQALTEAIALAHRIAGNAPVAVSQTLQAVDAILDDEDALGWEVTRRSEAVVRASQDAREGVAAFLEKREPRWTGR